LLLKSSRSIGAIEVAKIALNGLRRKRLQKIQTADAADRALPGNRACRVRRMRSPNKNFCVRGNFGISRPPAPVRQQSEVGSTAF
jgi:hypothetical protein